MAGRGATVQTPPTEEVGDLIAGKYRVERVIGEGGMGTVYAAYHQLLDVRVAVKVLSAELSEQPGIIARFLREARAVARLKSEHVARVSDIGMHEGQPFIVMELLEGEDLDKRLERGALAITDASDFILQALEAMAHAHAIGIVHRDLKPANLFVATSPDGREVLKVLDFGIAKLTTAAQGEGGRTGGITGEHALGSPSYMAPEQVRVLPQIDRRADLWALGAILYELVTGRTAFDGGSVGEIFGAVLHASPTPMREIRPETPPELEAVVERCLRRDVEERFTDAAEMARALAPFASPALRGHVSRIEQTLARAGKSSDPEGLRPSKLGLEQAALDAFGAEPGSGPRSVRRPLLSSRPATPAPGDLTRTADELPAPSGSTPPPVESAPPPPRSRSRSLMMPLAGVFGGCLVIALALRSLHGSLAEAPKTSAAVSPPAALAQPAHDPAQDLPAPKAAEPASPPVVESAAASAPPTSTMAPPQLSASASATGAAHKHAAPAKPATAATPHGKALPGVLQSPD
jgi:serine/threonine-protein kinase